MAFIAVFGTILIFFVQPRLDDWIKDTWGEKAEASYQGNHEMVKQSSSLDYLIYLACAATLAVVAFPRKQRAVARTAE